MVVSELAKKTGSDVLSRGNGTNDGVNSKVAYLRVGYLSADGKLR